MQGMKYPRVIAIGNQSSGKSSILENIVGQSFIPCGPGMVTKCPLFVRKYKSILLKICRKEIKKYFDAIQ